MTGWQFSASNEYACCFPTSIVVGSGSGSPYGVTFNYPGSSDPWCANVASSVTVNGNIQYWYTDYKTNANWFQFSVYNTSNSSIWFAQNISMGSQNANSSGPVELIYQGNSPQSGMCMQVYKSGMTLIAGLLSSLLAFVYLL